ELKRTGVTLQLLWREYKESHPEAYAYSQFCHHYYAWRKTQKVSMRMEHKAGDKMFVDFTGKKLTSVCPKTGDITEYEVFVAVLGASQLAYIEAVPSQQKHDWISANQNALRFYGGVPAAIVPDCLKSAVIKADKYEPQINESYNDFATHYGTVILPARALHPQDKSLAEGFVRHAYQQIYAPLRNLTFFSLEELNQALWDLLDNYNQKNFQKRDYSREQLFTQIEKVQLRALPSEYYEFKSFLKCSVQYNHHIYLSKDKHYYSVPFLYTGKKVDVRYTSRNVEVYFNNTRIAIHKRNIRPYEYTTNDEHRPEKHQFIAKWSAKRFLDWADKIDIDVKTLVQKIMDQKQHPEQAYKSCMGLLQLQKKYETEDYIKACRKAIKVQSYRYKFVKNTLENKTFKLSTEEELQTTLHFDHHNLRGENYYN
ncbi:MAG: IS21 family transposase, partial [Alphaproteobacteria bacterium]|nr:IS21 family transposase [Alphaproteobacteria bacterium]